MTPIAQSLTFPQKVQTAWNLFFGPSLPIPPTLPPAIAEESGARGRQYDYPTGVNLRYVPKSEEPTRIQFSALRGLADNYDVLRGVLETSKDEVKSLEWVIRPKDQKKKPSDDARCQTITDFLLFPDKMHSWSQWSGALLEDLFVVGTPIIYPRSDKGGKLYSLETIAPETIKIVIDQSGRRPIPPYPAFQQIIKGVPVAEFTSVELIHHPRDFRSNHIYPFSVIEWVIMTVNIAIRRQLHQLEFYTAGTVPDAIIGCPKEWNPDQIRMFQDYWDSLLEGNTEQRRHARFVPDGVTYHETKSGILKDEYDEWLARIICFFFNQPPTPFVKQMNRATAGSSAEQAKEQGSKVIGRWLADLMTNRILRMFFNAPDLEFAYKIEDDIDALNQAKIDQIYLQEYVISPNEVRERKGLEGPAPVKPLPPAMGQPTIEGGDDGTDGTDGGGGSGETGNANGSKKILPSDNKTSSPSGKAANPKGKKGAVVNDAKGGGKVQKADGGDFEHVTIDPLMFTADINRAKKKAITPIDRGRDEIEVIRSEIEDTVDSFLASESESFANQIQKMILDQQETDSILENLDFSNWSKLISPVSDKLQKGLNEGGVAGFAQISIAPTQDMTSLVNDQAVAYADDRAAELVGMKNIGTKDDPLWVENPNAEWAITDSTRDMIRSTVTQAQEEGWSTQKIAKELRESEGFSPDRAKMIAQTETAFADNHGNMAAYRASGVVTGKSWLTGSEHTLDDECNENEEEGVIGLDDMFSSGDDCAPAHPCCCCTVLPSTEESEE
jgi:hypothetical protein